MQSKDYVSLHNLAGRDYHPWLRSEQIEDSDVCNSEKLKMCQNKSLRGPLSVRRITREGEIDRKVN